MSKTKGMGKKRKGGVKISASKLANKRLNKLAKQGKLRKDKDEKKLKEKKAAEGRRGNEKQFRPVEKHVKEVEEDHEIGEEDIGFYKRKGKNSSFVANVRDSVLGQENGSAKKGKKRKMNEVISEEDYEKLPRKQTLKEGNKKMMLPIKMKHGFVQRMIETEHEDDRPVNGDISPDEGDEDEDGAEAEAEPLPLLTGVELYAQRQKKLRERKQRIAVLSSAVVANPQESTKKLRELVGLLKESDPDVFVTVRKYTMMSLLEVFKDIIPGYRLRLPTDKEKHQQMKKETKDLVGHEVGLVNCYREYLEFLDRTAKGKKVEISAKKMKRRKNKTPEESIPPKSEKAMKELSVKCLCELLVTHPHFNYTNNIIAVIVPFMNNHNDLMSDTACDCVRQSFREDKAGYVTLEITKCIGKMIKAREYRVKPKVLETFLSLRIKEVSYTDPVAKEEEKKKQHNDHLSRKEKKQKKKEMFIERDLEETKATEDKKKRLKLHTETIQAVFLTYFRILKKATSSVLFPSVLEGLAKFAHMISVDFFDDLFAVFNKLIADESLSYRESLHCVQTAFTILSGQGSVLNIDPVVFYRHFYKNLFHVHTGCTSGDVKVVLDCLDIMVSQRKRQVSQQRILAFLKRLMTLSLQQAPDGTIGLLSVIRSILITYSYTDTMLDNEAQGSGVYLPELDDPEHCQAHNTMLWELFLLRKHYSPTVRKLCTHLRHGAPTSGEGQLPPDLRKSPKFLYHMFESQDYFSNIPEKPRHLKHRTKRGAFLQSDVSMAVVQALDIVDDFVDIT
ncbi:nucleolar complex protein 3 homolog [Mya arenaria]|uniref:nucleolar complex protein 3 homolog n=1 Tax=Mya arenaria TaxID=6604 RepID=UPI0022E25AD9|nr:nucleolar complex protein 3 homolog [Mya arenaria]